MTHAYRALLKDRETIAAEVMHEYNEGVSGLILLVNDKFLITHFSSCIHVSTLFAVTSPL
jgi:hypothetical protein